MNKYVIVVKHQVPFWYDEEQMDYVSQTLLSSESDFQLNKYA